MSLEVIENGLEVKALGISCGLGAGVAHKPLQGEEKRGSQSGYNELIIEEGSDYMSVINIYQCTFRLSVLIVYRPIFSKYW